MSTVPETQHKRVSHAAAAELLATRDPVLDILVEPLGAVARARTVSMEAFWKPAAPKASRPQGGPGSGFVFFAPRVSELQAASG
jgi:hypothetical protein